METFNQPRCLLVGYKRPADFYTGVDYELENDESYFNLEFDENNIVEYEIERDSTLWSKIEERITVLKLLKVSIKNLKKSYISYLTKKVFYPLILVL